MNQTQIEQAVKLALAEDVGPGDITTEATVPADLQVTARIIAREAGVLAGIDVARTAFALVDPCVCFTPQAADGDQLSVGQAVAELSGPARGILTGERVALNFLQRLSGIATMAARYVAEVAGTKARVVDTRKTTPGLRYLEKYAIRVGGGRNHRFGLYDGVLIKDNHLAVRRRLGATNPVADAVRAARDYAPHTTAIEVEVESIEDARRAAEAGADSILLDNMSPAEMAEAVRVIAGRALTEASGGITLTNIRAVAEAGVDIISAGALTHSVKALDLSLEIDL